MKERGIVKEITQRLKEFGCNVEKAIERCINNEEFYVRLLTSFAKDASFQELGERIRQGNAAEAFNCAHTIKGVAANLELTPILEVVSAMVEKLRKGSLEGAEEDYQELMRAVTRYREIVSGA